MSAGKTVSVLVPVAVAGTYSYAVPEGLAVAPGDIVAAPLGTRDVIGVVWDDPPDEEIGHNRLRAIVGRFDAPPLAKELRTFVDWIANYTLTTRGMVLRMVLRAPGALEPEAPIVGVRLAGPLPERMTPARQRVVAMLEGGVAWSKSGLAAAAAVSPGVVAGLVEAGTLEPVSMPAPPLAPRPDTGHAVPVLNTDQEAGALALRRSVDAGGFSVTLLDGVTGSGKTEVYLEAAAAALDKGKQVLILIPEIALTAGFLERFSARFGGRPAEWHSEVTPRMRERVWRGVATGAVRAVIGARSALFLPFRELGLIVVDEEHDLAYKQEDRVFYNARDMAVVRGHLAGFPVVLSSATPSIESRVNADAGRYQRIVLPDRYASARLPDIAAIDLRKHQPERGRYLSPPLVAAVDETLAEKEQVLLFLNRRGYAPLTLCRTCGHRFQCPNCSTWLVEHRFRGILLCHHCGHFEPRPDHCPNCGDTESLVAVGPGVERLAEEVASRWPAARVIVMSSDIAGGVQRLRLELEFDREGRGGHRHRHPARRQGAQFPSPDAGRGGRRRSWPRLWRHAGGGADLPAPQPGDWPRRPLGRSEPGAGPDLRAGASGDPRHRVGRPRGLLRQRDRGASRCRPAALRAARRDRHLRAGPRFDARLRRGLPASRAPGGRHPLARAGGSAARRGARPASLPASGSCTAQHRHPGLPARLARRGADAPRQPPGAGGHRPAELLVARSLAARAASAVNLG